MHYGSYDFSSNGQPTILAKVGVICINKLGRVEFNNNDLDLVLFQDGGEVGSQGVLTGNDVSKLRAMYNC